MKPEIILFLFIIFLLLIILKKYPKKYTIVKIKKNKLKAEIADNPIKKTLGLMFRKSLPKNECMLFVFDKENYHPFWTLNMRFPIDIIWINKEKKVVDIAKDAKSGLLMCNSYNPEKKSKYVLETNANFTTKNKIIIGTKVIFTI